MEPRKYGPFPYTPRNKRPKLNWPNGARVALWVIPNMEVFALDEKMPAGPGGSDGLIPDVHTWSIRDYGARVGIFRIMEVLEKYGMRGTMALNSELCDAHHEIIEESVKLGWEMIGHNESNTRRLNVVPADEEKGVIHNTLAQIGKASGKKPVGWLGAGLQETWNTLDYLVEEGCLYVADWVNDDQPYLMDIGGKRLVSVPYSADINDKPAYEFHHVTADEFERMACRQFDVLYREGAESARVMAMAIHPYITGIPHRIGALEGILKYATSHEGVWLATGEEIAQAYLDTDPTV